MRPVSLLLARTSAKPLIVCIVQVADRVQVRVGDTVEMVVPVNPRSGKRIGHRVRRTAEATSPADGVDPGAAAAVEGDKKDGKKKKPNFVAERNPNAVKYTGHKLVSNCISCPRPPPLSPPGGGELNAVTSLWPHPHARLPAEADEVPVCKSWCILCILERGYFVATCPFG